MKIHRIHNKFPKVGSVRVERRFMQQTRSLDHFRSRSAKFTSQQSNRVKYTAMDRSAQRSARATQKSTVKVGCIHRDRRTNAQGIIILMHVYCLETVKEWNVESRRVILKFLEQQTLKTNMECIFAIGPTEFLKVLVNCERFLMQLLRYLCIRYFTSYLVYKVFSAESASATLRSSNVFTTQ